MFESALQTFKENKMRAIGNMLGIGGSGSFAVGVDTFIFGNHPLGEKMMFAGAAVTGIGYYCMLRSIKYQGPDDDPERETWDEEDLEMGDEAEILYLEDIKPVLISTDEQQAS